MELGFRTADLDDADLTANPFTPYSRFAGVAVSPLSCRMVG